MGPTRKDTRNLCVFSWNSLQVSVPVFQAYERDIKPVWLANSYRHASHIFIYPASKTISIKIFLQRFFFKGILFKTKTLISDKLKTVQHHDFSLGRRTVKRNHVTTDAVNQLHAKTMEHVTRYVTSRPVDTSASVCLVILATDVKRPYDPVTMSCFLGNIKTECTKY